MARPCLSKQTQLVQESEQNLTEQALHLVVGGQPEALPFLTTPVALVCLTLAQASLKLGDLLASASQVV